MNIRWVFQGLAMFAFALIALASPASALACEPTDDDLPRCQHVNPPSILKNAATAAVAISPPIKVAQTVKADQPQVATAANPRHGATPADAFAVTDGWQSLAPGTAAWWNLGYGKDAQILEVWLDANGQGGLALSIFAPDISNGLSVNTKPTGRGSYNKFEPAHDLGWRGQSPREGIWYALVTSNSPIPVTYNLSIQRTGVNRECKSYWEIINIPWAGPSDPIYWTLCQ